MLVPLQLIQACNLTFRRLLNHYRVTICDPRFRLLLQRVWITASESRDGRSEFGDTVVSQSHP